MVKCHMYLLILFSNHAFVKRAIISLRPQEDFLVLVFSLSLDERIMQV